MPLSPGEHLGAYQILSPLGAGGMGEVYRARDTKLNRDVAIKVLPAGLANDTDYLARFQREAQALAALHHPNIATIFGLEQNAIVMELVEGQNPKGPLPLTEALNIARQIAEALESAHDKGIIHRDLKPGNVIVTPEGVVKVLDFGLAKTAEKSAGPTTADSPTLTMRATEAGLILGTAGYMSPEQAAGKLVDRRADIWSFGVVLHELLTGKRLFDGETVSHTLAHVLTADVDLSKVSAGPIRDLIRRCLDRNLKTRLRDIGEARIAIENYLANPPQESQPAPTQGSRWPWVAAAAAFGLAALALAVLHFSEAKPVLPVVTTTLLAPEGEEYDFNAPHGLPALSPDGTRLVYAAKGKDGKTQLWLRRLDSPFAQPLANTETAATPFWSPDSQWIAFGQRDKLKKIDLQGGAPVTIADLPDALRGGSWNAAGVIVLGANSGYPILKVAATGGKAIPVTVHQKGAKDHRHPWFLPDGRHFLYAVARVAGNTIHVGSLDEPDKPGRMVAEASGPAVYAQGYLLYLRDDNLMAQPFDVTRLAATGEAVQLAEGIPTYTTASRIAAFAASPGGLLVHQGGGAGRSRLLWKDRQGKVLETLGEVADEIRGVALSPDGKRVAVHLRTRADTEDLWIFEGGSGFPARFTFGPKRNREEVWSPDGSMIYFTSDRSGTGQDIYRKASNGTGSEELLWSDGAANTVTCVSPDGKWLLYSRNTSRNEAGTRRDLMLLPLGTAGKAEPQVFLQSPLNEHFGQFSPDGQWIAYVADDMLTAGAFIRRVYVAPFSGAGGKRQISVGENAVDAAMLPRWRRDGKEIFYVTRNGNLMAAAVSIRNGAVEVGKVEKLFEGIVINRFLTYDVSADGRRFLVVDDGVTTARPLTLVQNWVASLKK